MLTPAHQVSTGTVYSLHKSATRAHVARVASGELRAASAQVLAQLRFDLPATYAFHRRGPCRGLGSGDLGHVQLRLDVCAFARPKGTAT